MQSFPAGAGRFQISNGGGTQPRWRRDGKELFYITPDGKMMAVDVKIGAGFEAGPPHVLFDTRSPDYQTVVMGTWQYDVSPDGKRFLFSQIAQDGLGAPDYMTVVTNWLAGVKRGGVAPGALNKPSPITGSSLSWAHLRPAYLVYRSVTVAAPMSPAPGV